MGLPRTFPENDGRRIGEGDSEDEASPQRFITVRNEP